MDTFTENYDLSVLVIYEYIFQTQNGVERELDFLLKAFSTFLST